MRGVALIAVLWLVALLVLLATAVATMSVSHRRAAQRLVDAASLDSIADSAIRLTAFRIVAPQPSAARVAAGNLHVQLFETPTDVTIEREQGRVDLNSAEDELLFALFAANGWTDQAAQSVVARIADWKDVDDEPRQNGAERQAYAEAGLGYGPRNGPFESVEEVRQLLGAEDLSLALMSSLTVYTHAQTPLPAAASETVMRALRLADERQLGGHRWLQEELSTSGAVNPTAEGTNLVGEVVRISACAHRGRFERCRSAVLHLTGSMQSPWLIYSWQSRFRSPALHVAAVPQARGGE
jgi:general secretion pathway protein K